MTADDARRVLVLLTGAHRRDDLFTRAISSWSWPAQPQSVQPTTPVRTSPSAWPR